MHITALFEVALRALIHSLTATVKDPKFSALFNFFAKTWAF
jgi:hypothetical protein